MATWVVLNPDSKPPTLPAEDKLVKTGALQDAIFQSAYFSSIATDEKGVIQIFNVGAERMLGYQALDVVNRLTPAEISDPQELIARASALSVELGTPINPGFEALVFKAARGIEDIYDLTYIRKDGSRFPAIVSVTALRDAQAKILGYLLIGTDNTARKQVEATQALLDQRLRDQQFYTRSLIESNMDALMTTDPQGIISDVNQEMIALTGCTRDELIGMPCRDCFTDPIRADAAIKRVLAENKISDFELTVRSRSGEETVVSYNAAVFYNRSRQLQGVFAAARDVTERKRFERALLEKNIELEHATRMKSEFLATMSHELRTPLNAIIGFSEALKDGLLGQMSDTQREYVGDICTSGQHLLSLINDILDLSKVEAGMMALELEPIDLYTVLSESLSIMRVRAAAQHITLECDVPVDLGGCQLDVRKTKQIVYNLLTNALKFSGETRRVTLRGRRVSRSEVAQLPASWPMHSFALTDNGFSEFLAITVSDSGIGISPANMPKLFQAFVQIDSSLSRKFEGTGLGLAMVKQLAELHGGTVGVASIEGEGACFGVWLPLRSTAPGTALVADVLSPVTEPTLTEGAPDPLVHTALLLEEDESTANLLTLLLESEGFEVLRAANADDALALVPPHGLTLIALDVLSLGLDPDNLLAKIRETRSLAEVPVMMISSDAEGGGTLPVSGDPAGMLQKPVTRARLKSALAQLGVQPSEGHRYTVLIVDDDPKAVAVIAALLPSAAYLVLRAYGGHDAIAISRRVPPDLMLLDLMMPDVNGMDVIKALRRDVKTTNIPILIVTAKDLSVEERAAFAAFPGPVIEISSKAGLTGARFTSAVTRLLQKT